jgi:hypothetical protein
MVNMLGDDDDMPHAWNMKDANELEDEEEIPSDPRHSPSPGGINQTSNRNMSNSLSHNDSKSDVSKLINKSKISNQEKKPQTKLEKKYDIDDAVEFSDDDDDINSDDYADKVNEITNIKNKQVSEEWNPKNEKKFMDKLIELHLKDKSQLTNDENRIAEQQLMLKKNYSTYLDKSGSPSKHDISAEKENSWRSSVNRSKEVIKKRSPVIEKIKAKEKSPVMNKSKSKGKIQKKLTMVNEASDPSEETYTPKKYSSKKRNDPDPQFDDRGKVKFEFQDENLPQLDVDTLAKIRDQLLLQKMYENDLQNFKKFKKTKGKKRTKTRGNNNLVSADNCKYTFLII